MNRTIDKITMIFLIIGGLILGIIGVSNLNLMPMQDTVHKID